MMVKCAQIRLDFLDDEDWREVSGVVSVFSVCGWVLSSSSIVLGVVLVG